MGTKGLAMIARMTNIAVLAAGLFLLSAEASAQLLNPQIERRQGYDPQPMNFELWCQETARYSNERCAQRLTGDVREFEDYRSIIERFELETYMEQRHDAEALKQVDRNYGAPWADYNDPRVR
jgi:hypothetical protein